ncbi:hypothetical protein MKW92_037248, partial [Papaver armeniacum]
ESVRETNIVRHLTETADNTAPNMVNEVHHTSHLVLVNQHGVVSGQPNGEHPPDDQTNLHLAIAPATLSNSVPQEGDNQAELPSDLKYESKIALVLFSVSSGSVTAVTVVLFEQRNVQ